MFFGKTFFKRAPTYDAIGENLNYATFYLFYGSLSNIIITFFCVLFVCFNLFNSPLAEQITSPRGFQIMFLIVF